MSARSGESRLGVVETTPRAPRRDPKLIILTSTRWIISVRSERTAHLVVYETEVRGCCARRCQSNSALGKAFGAKRQYLDAAQSCVVLVKQEAELLTDSKRAQLRTRCSSLGSLLSATREEVRLVCVCFCVWAIRA